MKNNRPATSKFSEENEMGRNGYSYLKIDVLGMIVYGGLKRQQYVEGTGRFCASSAYIAAGKA